MARRTGLLRTSLHVFVYALGVEPGSMDSDYDPESEAETAIKLAAATDGPERESWDTRGHGVARDRSHADAPQSPCREDAA